ncbi:Rossmann-like and DUF2520 domain-containing protein [Myroides indicus]|uniref:Putative short-subunit dehydrogenase-like oxidoreductase (DUF2520 family) n=1 Tax=Myroides indicus TaxID=1323422 RepID=A0A4R7EXT5_9FLAO|nr:DUF2520 domain-containing protein [Myroides indicus]TDS53834.1 putative short-subunit dehydrogenase-like oxidoreductase (DUF2520 family) [Myroides indicus]
MITISILGSGKVAYHLVLNILEQDNLHLQQIYARNIHEIDNLVNADRIVTNINDLKPADVFFIAVSDDAIGKVSKSICLKNQLIVHVSGTISIEAIQNSPRKGVFYMLQTFSKDRKVDFSQIPFCIEATTTEDFSLLEQIALCFSEKVYKINSEQRKAIHLAAVFVNNFTNHMYILGEEICKENKVPFDILKPLIAETANKINSLSPKNAQTGPAIRNDQTTIDKHLDLLKNKNYKDIYRIITKSIQNIN